jgi:putative transposase
VRERQQMVAPAHRKLSVRRQCEALGISRSGWYSGRDRQPSRRNLELMKTIDRIYTEWPWYGSRRIRAVLLREGRRVNRKRIQRLMRAMGIAGVAPRRSCSRPTPGHAMARQPTIREARRRTMAMRATPQPPALREHL